MYLITPPSLTVYSAALLLYLVLALTLTLVLTLDLAQIIKLPLLNYLFSLLINMYQNDRFLR